MGASGRSRGVGVVVSVLALFGLVPSGAAARSAGRLVRFGGYTLSVPSRWPVFDLRSHPRTCVRFDRHAVYLGRPRRAQRCPAHLVGRTEAILLEPRRRRRAALTVSWSHDPHLIERVLGVSSLHGFASPSSATGAAAGRLARQAASSRSPARRASGSGAAIYTGLGFDACSAPSAAQIGAWSSSPYRALAIYIGGANRACAQPNLNPEWVVQQTAAGWHLIPTYVGPQAPGSGCGCATILAADADAEGQAAALDAVAQAQALGFGVGNPIYYDMEGYSHTPSDTSVVLAFLAAWSSKLHALGYLSGVYSSTGSGIADLVGVVGTSFPEPDEIWIADWNGQPTTGDAAVPAADWVAHQRIHQYEGAHNETYGGATINVDSDAVDTATAQPGYTALFPDGTFVQVSGTQQVYRIAGGAPLPLVDWSTVGGPQAVVTITEQQLQMLPPVPANGTFLGTAAGAYYRVAGGAPLILTNWSLFGGVRPFVTIDPWDIENLSNPAAHLLAQPIDGTVVQGLPSHGYWWFSRGRRVPARPSRRAVRVDDAGLARFPIVTCVVPRLRHLTFPSAKRALRSAYCRLGKVRRPRHWPRTHRLRVVWQVPQPGIVRRAWWRVGLGLR